MSPLDRSTRHPEAASPAFARGIVALVLLAGIMVTVAPGAHGQRVSKLSDAAKEARKPPAEQRPLQGSDKEPSSGVVVVTSVAVSSCVMCPDVVTGPYPVPYPVPSPGPYHEPYDYEDPSPPFFNQLHVGAVAASGSLSSPDFGTSSQMGLRVGTGDSRRTMVDLVLLGGPARFTPGSDIADALRNPREIGLEGSVRYELVSRRAPIGIAPLAGFRVGRLSWRYANPILVENSMGLREVDDDDMWHYSPFFGLALTAVRFRHVEVAITGISGWRHYAAQSGEGFTNDLFDDDHFRELRIETRIF